MSFWSNYWLAESAEIHTPAVAQKAIAGVFYGKGGWKHGTQNHHRNRSGGIHCGRAGVPALPKEVTKQKERPAWNARRGADVKAILLDPDGGGVKIADLIAAERKGCAKTVLAVREIGCDLVSGDKVLRLCRHLFGAGLDERLVH